MEMSWTAPGMVLSSVKTCSAAAMMWALLVGIVEPYLDRRDARRPLAESGRHDVDLGQGVGDMSAHPADHAADGVERVDIDHQALTGFGIDHLVMGEQRALALLPGGGAYFRIIRNLAAAPGRVECVEKLATERARSGRHRKEEAAATVRGLPLPCLIEPAAGNECV